MNNQYSTENGQCVIVFSFLMIIGGFAWIFFYNRSRKNWEEEIQNAEEPIDIQISRIQQEIERHKKIARKPDHAAHMMYNIFDQRFLSPHCAACSG